MVSCHSPLLLGSRRVCPEHPPHLFGSDKQTQQAPCQEKQMWESTHLSHSFLELHLNSQDKDQQQNRAQSSSGMGRNPGPVRVEERFKGSPLSKAKPEEWDGALLQACKTATVISKYLHIWQQDYYLTANMIFFIYFFFRPGSLVYISQRFHEGYGLKGGWKRK